MSSSFDKLAQYGDFMTLTKSLEESGLKIDNKVLNALMDSFANEMTGHLGLTINALVKATWDGPPRQTAFVLEEPEYVPNIPDYIKSYAEIYPIDPELGW